MKKILNTINENIPSDCQPWLDEREFISVSYCGNFYFWDVPNNHARSSRTHSVVETDDQFVVWVIDNVDGEVRRFTVNKPLTAEDALEWVTKKQLFRYLIPVNWYKGVDPKVDTLVEASLLGMPPSVRDEFVKWAKGFHEVLYPNQEQVLNWISTHY